MIHFVVFDLGGVLCDVALERGRARCVELGYPTAVFEAVEGSGAKFEADRGRMAIRSMLEAVRAYCPEATSLAQEELEEMWGAVVSWRDYVPRVLSRLRVGYGVLSVIDPIHAKALGPLPGASPLVYSCNIGHVKPVPAAYAELLRQCSHSAEKILFVDDRAENVRSARQSGLIARRVHDEATLLEALGPVLR